MGMLFDTRHTSDFKVYLKEKPKIPMTPEIKDHYEVIAGRNGSYHFPQPFGDRIISVSCVLLADSQEERVELVREIAGWLTTTTARKIQFDDDPKVHYVGKLNKQINFDSAISHGVFEVEFRCDSFKIGNQVNEVVWEAATNSLKQILADGTGEIRPTLQISAKYGVITNPVIEMNGYTFMYNGTIASGGKIVIKSESFTLATNPNIDVVVTGAFDPNAYSALDKMEGAFPIMQGGGNSLLYRAANNASAEIRLVWEDTFI